MAARIFKPTKTAMQSGRGNTQKWVLEFEPKDAKRADPLMGWPGSRDTEGQVRLRFQDHQEAVAYCQRMGLDYSIAQPQSSTPKPKAYADNFAFNRMR
jgi:hypothetical protein